MPQSSVAPYQPIERARRQRDERAEQPAMHQRQKSAPSAAAAARRPSGRRQRPPEQKRRSEKGRVLESVEPSVLKGGIEGSRRVPEPIAPARAGWRPEPAATERVAPTLRAAASTATLNSSSLPRPEEPRQTRRPDCPAGAAAARPRSGGRAAPCAPRAGFRRADRAARRAQRRARPRRQGTRGPGSVRCRASWPARAQSRSMPRP